MCLGIESCSTFLQPVSSPGLPAAFSEFGASLLDMEVPSSQRFRRSVASLQDCVGDDPRPQLRLADISEHGRFAGAALLHPGPLPLSIQNQMPSPEGELSPDPKLHKVHRQAYPRRRSIVVCIPNWIPPVLHPCSVEAGAFSGWV